MPKMKELPVSDRPYERLVTKGVNYLSNEELLSILIKSGTKNVSAKVVATNVLKEVKTIQELSKINLEKLLSINGIGISKACNILAAIELGRRVNIKIDNINNVKITNSKIVYNYYKEIIGDSDQEQFYCLYLDNGKKVKKEKLLFIGTTNYSLVHPREVFKEAYLVSASGIICIHNHPSGNTLPSKEDFDITDKLVKIGNIMGIKIIDHVIISKNNYYSFFENNDLC